MPAWSFPGVVTEAPHRHIFGATLDLGLHWRHPVTLHIAGIQPATASPMCKLITALLPEGTRFQAICERPDLGEPIRAHIVLEDGTDVAMRVRHRKDAASAWEFGGDPKTKTWHYPAVIDRVIDADTIAVRADVGVRSYPVASVRIGHVNAPEHGTAEGDAATVWAEQQLTPGMSVEIASKRLDRYGRILGDVLLTDGTDYGADLIAAGHAVPYEGGLR